MRRWLGLLLGLWLLGGAALADDDFDIALLDV